MEYPGEDHLDGGPWRGLLVRPGMEPLNRLHAGETLVDAPSRRTLCGTNLTQSPGWTTRTGPASDVSLGPPGGEFNGTIGCDPWRRNPVLETLDGSAWRGPFQKTPWRCILGGNPRVVPMKRTHWKLRPGEEPLLVPIVGDPMDVTPLMRFPGGDPI
jgi:hypothetical protein